MLNSSMEFCAACELANVANAVFGGSSQVVMPLGIYNNLGLIANFRNQGAQEDAHEFMKHFLHRLHEDMTRAQVRHVCVFFLYFG